MFSIRLLWLFSVYNKLFQVFGIFYGGNDRDQKSFHLIPGQQWKAKLTFNITLLWCLSIVIISVKYFRLGDIDRYNMTIACSLVISITMLSYSIFRWYSHDICILLNGFTKFVDYLQSKFFTVIKNLLRYHKNI